MLWRIMFSKTAFQLTMCVTAVMVIAEMVVMFQ